MIKRYKIIESDMLMKEVECFTNAILTICKEELESLDEQQILKCRKEFYELGKDFYTSTSANEFDLYSRIETILKNYGINIYC